MSDKFQPLTMEQLTHWIFAELDERGSIFGLPRELFFVPSASDRFRLELYGQPLETPFGVAAGPHSQMAENIIAAWLCGGRFIELKTVQTLDELDVAKPCIDMQDEGYNVEWSQELKVRQSFEEYLRAWVLIHALHRKLGLPGDRPGLIFNMSVGYDLAGIKQDNVQWFLDQMHHAGDRLGELTDLVARAAPEVRDVEIPARISDNVTLSTMHGCPPAEIGLISRYLIEERGLHTSVKLNPTLLGPDRVRGILNETLGFHEIEVPDLAFEHDLKYPDAVELLSDLQGRADARGVTFGVKLCNTLEVSNHRTVFDPEGSQMMYMSGRSHHALAVNLADKLWRELDGRLLMSFAGGADALNVVDLLAAGMTTVTTSTDLLKPGSYLRLLQYLDQTAAALETSGAADIDGLIRAKAAARLDPGAPEGPIRELAGANLSEYAARVLTDRRYHKAGYDRSRTKTSRPLGLFDCIMAPCTDTCAVSQQVPRYMDLVRRGELAAAAAVTRDDNPMAAVLGRACTHPCELTCSRTHLDQPLAIREIKRFVMEHEAAGLPEAPAQKETKVAVVGAGPCGLSAAYFLTRAGYPVTIFEAQPYSGGMVSGSIPAYRATQAVIDQDLEAIRAFGLEVRHGQEVGRDLDLDQIRDQGFEHIVLAAGARRGLRLGIPGEDGEGVLDGLDLLRASREGQAPPIGRRVGVIGGGDVAMDCARTAARLTSEDGRVNIIYRRTLAQMPAQAEELEEVLDEGIAIRELLAPREVRLENGRIAALVCDRMELGEPDASGRRRPLPTGETEEVELDTLIVAIGQEVDPALLGALKLKKLRRGFLEVDPETLETEVPGLFAGGDLIAPGPQTIVKALGDGKRIAAAIRGRVESTSPGTEEVDLPTMLAQRARQVPRVEVPRREADPRAFEEVIDTYSAEAAKLEAARCLRCDLLCSVCVSVCPNRAFFTYQVEPWAASLARFERRDGEVVEQGPDRFGLGQRFQVAVVTDLCNECGNCVTFCPTAGRPYQDKPRLYLTRSELEAQDENAFHVTRDGETWTVEARFGGKTHRLTQRDGLRYESPLAEVTLDPASLRVRQVKPSDAWRDGDRLSLAPLAAMWSLLQGIRGSMGHLPL